MSSEELYRHKRYVEVLAARAELLVQMAAGSEKLRGYLNDTLEIAYRELDKLDNQPAGWLFVPALTERLDAVSLVH